MAGASPEKKGSGSSLGAPPLEIDLNDLDVEFDELIGESPGTATVVKAEGAVKAEVKSEADPTPKKRRRVGRFPHCGGSSSQSLGHGVADLVADDDEHDGSEAAAVAGGTAQEEHKVCIGCDRIKGVSRCYVRPGEKMQWGYPDGRGAWCKDCAATWRTNFEERAFMTDLETWLKVDPVKRAEFQVCRLAYLTLVFEGHLGCIQRAHVQERLQLLKWMSHVSCMCFESHVVVPFEEAAAGDSPWHRFAAMPSHLTTIHSEGAHRLGVCVCAHI